MIDSHPNGAVVTVRVVPRAARAGLAGIRDGALLVRLNAAPVEGAANAELIDILAAALGVPRRAITIVAGDKSRRKRVLIEGVTPTQVATMLAL